MRLGSHSNAFWLRSVDQSCKLALWLKIIIGPHALEHHARPQMPPGCLSLRKAVCPRGIAPEFSQTVNFKRLDQLQVPLDCSLALTVRVIAASTLPQEYCFPGVQFMMSDWSKTRSLASEDVGPNHMMSCSGGFSRQRSFIGCLTRYWIS